MSLEILVVISIVLLFGLTVFLIVRSERKGRDTKLQISRSLGFTPLEPSPELVQKISQLYQNLRKTQPDKSGDIYKLQSVSSKRMVDCEMIIFDLIDTSGDDNSYTEVQAVAMIAPHLTLPAFALFPRADLDGPLTNMANKVMGWVISRFGDPVSFPEFPEFERRYLVSSLDAEGTRRFLDEIRLQRLANTRLIGIHAGGDIFTLSHIATSAKPLTREIMNERIRQAMDVYSIFTG